MGRNAYWHGCLQQTQKNHIPTYLPRQSKGMQRCKEVTATEGRRQHEASEGRKRGVAWQSLVMMSLWVYDQTGNHLKHQS